MTVIVHQHAVAYAEMKWPRLAPHSRASLADALATVTPLLTRDTGRRPTGGGPARRLVRTCLQPAAAVGAPDPDTASALAWLEQVYLPANRLGEPRVIRAALDGLCTRLDGTPAAANTIGRKRAVFHGALGYAVELGLLPANPSAWCAGAAEAASLSVRLPAEPGTGPGDPEPAHPHPAGTGRVLRLPYYAALRPQEAVALRPQWGVVRLILHHWRRIGRGYRRGAGGVGRTVTRANARPVVHGPQADRKSRRAEDRSEAIAVFSGADAAGGRGRGGHRRKDGWSAR